MFAFRSLQTRIVVFFVILLVTVQSVAFVLISAVGEKIATERLERELQVGERVFQQVIDQSNRQLVDAARVLAADFAFRSAIATRDFGTIVSALRNHGARIEAQVVLLADLNGRMIADTLPPRPGSGAFPFPELIKSAQQAGTASAVVLIEGRPYQIVVVPVLAPVPIAWVAMGFMIAQKQVSTLRSITGMHVSFLSRGTNREWSLNASTLPVAMRDGLLTAMAKSTGAHVESAMTLDGEPFETLDATLSDSSSGQVVAVLQLSLREGLESIRALGTMLIALAIASIILSIFGSVVLARGITGPLNRLNANARRIRDGDYSKPPPLDQTDEVGELAESFNTMLDSISRRESEILRLAYEDALTSLPNRAMFNDRLLQAVKIAQRNGNMLSVLSLDIDRFKYINDSLGHTAGDQVLKEVAGRLQALLRDSDTVARLGGDEFGILLPTVTNEGVQLVVQRILRTLEQPIMLEGQPVDVGASIGVASCPEHGTDPRMLLRHADVAMYEAKRDNSGYAIYDPRYETGRPSHLSLLGELRRAVESNELVLYYQPKVDLKTGSVHRAEALVRWIHPTRGFIPPLDFILFAEQTGYIKQVTRWVVEEGIRQAGQWQHEKSPIAISINISARDLMNLDLADFVAKQLAHHGVPPELICLEITENGLMEDHARAQDVLEHMHKLGVRLSIDDFGTGYSSLAYLKKLPVQELKIDRTFVMNIEKDDDDAIIVRSTIELGHNMGMEVVAEGVETQSAMDLLAALGCDQAQGYLISKPLPADQFSAWLIAREKARTASLSPIA